MHFRSKQSRLRHFLSRLVIEPLEDRRVLSADLGGTSWFDFNGDGIQNVGEPPVGGATVKLFDPVDGIIGNGNDFQVGSDQITDGAGTYLFQPTAPDDYYVQFVAPGNLSFTLPDQGADDTIDSDADPATGNTAIISLADLEVNLTVDAGLVGPDRFEPNNSFATAADIGVGPGVHLDHLLIDQAGDEDWYQFEVLRADDVDLGISFSHAAGDLNLEVRNDQNAVIGSGTSLDDDELVTLSLTAGTYYVRVFGVASAQNLYQLAIDPAAASATTVYYVNDGATANDLYTQAIGSDANTGLTPGDPKASLQSVFDDYDLGATDLVLIDTGSYAVNAVLLKQDEGLVLAGSPVGSTFTSGGTNLQLVDADFNTVYGLAFQGSTGLYIRGDGDAATNNVIRANTFTSNASYGIRISDAADSDQILDNVLTGSGSLGIWMADGSNATIMGNQISGRNTGMQLSIDNSVVQANTVSSGATRGIYLTGTSNVQVLDNLVDTFTNQGIYVTNSTNALMQGNEVSFADAGIESTSTAATTTFLDNDIHDNTIGLRGYGTFGPSDWSGGLDNDIYNNVTGIFADNNATVQFNRIHHNTTGVRVDDAADVNHNILFRNTGQGIYLIDGDNVTITNNTIYTPAGDGVRLESNSSNVTLRNNIIWTESGGYDVYVATDSQIGFDSDYNNLFSSGTGQLVWWQKPFTDLFDWQVEANFDNNSIGYTAPDPTLDDPQFVNLAGDDFHLTNVNSTSIDAGDPSFTFGNEPLPAGDRINLGAYGNTTEAALSRTAFVELAFPNYYTDWEVDFGQSILWRTHNVTPTDLVDIDLYEVGFGKVADIADVPAGDGSYGWSPSDNGIAGDTNKRYRVVITVTPTPSITDQSREGFSIPTDTTSFYVDDSSNTDDEYTPVATGDNRNTGTTVGDPKANLLPLLRNYDLDPGDTVNIDTGNYIHVRNVVISGELVLGNDEGATFTGPNDPTKVAEIDRANTNPSATNIDVDDGDFVTIRQLTLTGAERGIWVHNGSTNFNGTELIVSNNSLDGIRLESDAAFSTLDELEAFGNGRYGVYVGTEITSVSHSLAYNNADTGIYLTQVGDAVVQNNEAYGNNVGIFASNSLANTETQVGSTDLAAGLGNNVHDNLSVGITGSSNVLIAGNTVFGQSGSGDWGITLASGADASRNVVHSNDGGILSTGVGTQIDENRVYNQTSTGINARVNSHVLRNVVYSNNVGLVAQNQSSSRFRGIVRNNLIYDNTSRGILVTLAAQSGSERPSFISNTVFQETGDAIRIEGSSKNVDLRNNILWVDSGFNISVADDSQVGFSSDFNLLRTTGTGQVAFWQGLARPDLIAWQNTAFTDALSLAQDPLFVDITAPLGYVSPADDGRDDDFHLQSDQGSFHGGALAPVEDGGTGLPVLLTATLTADAIRAGDWNRIGELMYSSHASLRDEYDVSCDEVDLLVELAAAIGSAGGVFGSRMTGAGFGGCTVSLVRTKFAAEIAQEIRDRYLEKTGIEPALFASRPAKGAHEISQTGKPLMDAC